MGWNIQHIPGRTENRPYSLVADALTAAVAVLPPDQASALDIILKRRGDAWLELTTGQTAAIRDALNAAQSRVRWRPQLRKYLPVIRDIAEAADTAHRTGALWRWS